MLAKLYAIGLNTNVSGFQIRYVTTYEGVCVCVCVSWGVFCFQVIYFN